MSAASAEQLLADQTLSEGLTARLLHLASDNAFAVAGIMFVSMAAACGLVSIINQARGDATDFGDEAFRKKFNRASKGLANLFGFAFSAMGVYGYLTGGLLERIYLTLMLALIASGFTPALYDAFRWGRDRAGPAAGRAIIDGMRAGAKLLVDKAALAITALFKNRPKPPPDDKDPKP